MGLAFMDSEQSRIKWHQLLTEMVAFGLLTYALLINQLEWLMTPPRSELWAACFGASLAVAWCIARLKLWPAMRVAVWSSLGAGFGFAFGNVLQVLGSSLSIPLNLWNVMEYSIGFCGGLGMSYATLTSTWPQTTVRQGRFSNIIPILILAVIIPFIIWDQSFIPDKLTSLLSAGGTPGWIAFLRVVSLAIVLMMAILFFWIDQRHSTLRVPYDAKVTQYVFLVYLGVYTFFSFLVTGVYRHPAEQYLYIVNIAAFLLILTKTNGIFGDRRETFMVPMTTLIIIISVLALAAMIMIHSHDELKGSQVRF